MAFDDQDPFGELFSRTLWDVTRRELERYAQAEHQPAVPRPIRRRQMVIRDHVGAAERLLLDFFAEEPRWGPTVFRRCFRMRRELFVHIVNTLSARYGYFQQHPDASCRPRLSPLQKCTTAIGQLAYGGAPDMFDEYFHVADTTGSECQKYFCKGVIETFGATYLRSSTLADCQYLIDLHGRVHDFPGMLGSINCMHWQWKNCPTTWRGQFTIGFKGTHPTIILEAIADQRL